jgi:ATP-dependent Clp protease protease subunit
VYGNGRTATIERDTERDRFLSASEAVEYGLVDSILTHRQ